MTENTANFAVRFRGTIFSNSAPVRTADTMPDTTVRKGDKSMKSLHYSFFGYDTHIASRCAVSYRPYHRGFKGEIYGH